MTIAVSSSGGGRFFPVDGSDSSSETASVPRPGLLSGVCALNTGVAALRSGVLGRGRDDGPEATRLLGMRAGLEGAKGSPGAGPQTVFDLGREVEGVAKTGDVSLFDALGGSETGVGIGGIDALAAASFVCRLWTLRVSASTFSVSFLLFFSNLFGLLSIILLRKATWTYPRVRSSLLSISAHFCLNKPSIA